MGDKFIFNLMQNELNMLSSFFIGIKLMKTIFFSLELEFRDV